jgi:RNA polymerase sigma-70 factor (ECF subfamily)
MQSNHLPNEHDLIEGCLLGNPIMQKKLYDKFAAKMYGICLRYAANSEDAKDILQDGFVKVFTNLIKFKAAGSFEGWMRRIFVNTAIENYRRKNQLYAITENQEERIPNQEVSALDTLEADDIVRLISELPNGYRTVFNLFAVEGYSHKEIATMMNISEGTSKSQYARAKAWLQEKIGSRNQDKG